MASSTHPVKKIPVVRFRYLNISKQGDFTEIKNILGNCFLRDGYDRVKFSYKKSSFVDLTKNNCSFSISINDDRYENNFIIVSVFPLPSALFYLRKGAVIPDKFIPSLRYICDSLDKLLRSTVGVESVHWYFEWAECRSKVVWTPGELPWRD